MENKYKIILFSIATLITIYAAINVVSMVKEFIFSIDRNSFIYGGIFTCLLIIGFKYLSERKDKK